MRRSTVRLVGVCTAHRITRKKAVHTGARALQGSEETGAPEASHVVPLCFQQPLVTQEEDLCRCVHVAPVYGALPLPSLLWAVEFLTCPVFRRLAAVTYAPELAAGEEDSCVSSPHSPMLTAISWGSQPGGKGRSTQYWPSAPQSDSGPRPKSQDGACSAVSRAAGGTPASRCPISNGGAAPTMSRAFGACYSSICTCKTVYCNNTA